MFNPGWLSIFINPFYFARLNLYRGVREFAPCLSGQLLDIGCGSKPYRTLFDVHEYVGLEIESEVARKSGIAEKFYDGVVFPFADDTFDSVFSSQVFEHVFESNRFLKEIYRVLKPNGRLLMTVPLVWDEHEQPNDYFRYTSFGLKAVLVENGFDVISQKKLCTDSSVVFQIANAYLFKVTAGWNKHCQRLFTLTVIALINVIGIVAGKILPDNNDLYLDNIILVEKRK